MARILNVEKSQYLDKNIEVYTGNKVGQYSKYLDKNPLFVTYLHINSAESRSDVGIGGVNSDVGPSSPIRFNQINGLPVYNIPELKPSTDYGDNGYDIELDLSDITLLPNTIKPSTGDYLIIVLPDTIEFAFRVNSFEYNTIQSNDFYTFSADLKFTGHDLIDKFKSQIVQEYETIFENIGTDDKCFILTKDIEKIQNIGKLIIELRDNYFANFFDKETGTFVCQNNPVTKDGAWLYDKYLEKFIMDSQIYYKDNDPHSVILKCADIEPPEMDRLYMQSLWYAVLNRTSDYLASNPHYYQVDIQKRLSPFKIYDINCKGVNLVLTKNELVRGHSDAIDSGMVFEYFSHTLIQLVKGELTLEEMEEFNQKIDELRESLSTTKNPSSEERIVTKMTHDESGNAIYNVYALEPEGDANPPEEDNVQEEGEEVPSIPSEIPMIPLTPATPIPLKKEIGYLENLIYMYLTNQTVEIERKELISYSLQVDNYTYRMMPLVIYIVQKYYDSYFKKEEL